MLLLIISWYIPFFESDISLSKDGSLLIEENITVNFDDGYYHGIYRDIPLELKGRVGNYALGFAVKKVLVDGRKVKVKKSTERPGGWTHLRLRIGDPDVTITGKHTYTIVYSVLLGARFLGEYDELYWNITGNRWEARIDSSEFSIILPEPIQLEDNEVKIFKGEYGTRNTLYNFVIGESVISGGSGTLYAGDGVTIAIKFPKGYLKAPSIGRVGLLWLRNNFYFFIPLIALVLLFIHWYRNGRDISPGTIKVEYEPPVGLTAAEVGTILDQKVDTVDVISILFDLARLGYLTIEEEESRKFLFLKNKDYRIKINKDPEQELTYHLRKFLWGLIKKGGRDFLISDLKGEFYSYYKDVKKSIYKSIAEKKAFYGNPETIRGKYLGVGFLILFPGFFFIPILPKAGISFIITGLIFTIFSKGMPKWTPIGRKILLSILGFREFLMRVEKDRLKRMLDNNPTLFFDYLSYAVALGVVDEWADRFSGLEVTSPGWYTSPGMGNVVAASVVASSVGDSIGAFSTTMSPPRGSSSGFGGGGGGFSGGGGGGGGGGAW